MAEFLKSKSEELSRFLNLSSSSITGPSPNTSFGPSLDYSKKADLTSKSDKDLLNEIMPTENELVARSCTSNYAKLLVDSSRDAFVRRSKTEAYKELLKRMPSIKLNKLIFEGQTLIKLRKKITNKLPKDAIAEYMAVPELRHQVLAWLPNHPIATSQQACFASFD